MSKPTGRAGQWSAWYSHSRWRSLRKRQLFAEPLCVFCEREGRIELATVCDHITPHKGDREAFWSGPFQSLCERCHNSTKQAEDKGGARRVAIDIEGWPTPDL